MTVKSKKDKWWNNRVDLLEKKRIETGCQVSLDDLLKSETSVKAVIADSVTGHPHYVQRVLNGEGKLATKLETPGGTGRTRSGSKTMEKLPDEMCEIIRNTIKVGIKENRMLEIVPLITKYVNDNLAKSNMSETERSEKDAIIDKLCEMVDNMTAIKMAIKIYHETQKTQKVPAPKTFEQIVGMFDDITAGFWTAMLDVYGYEAFGLTEPTADEPAEPTGEVATA